MSIRTEPGKTRVYPCPYDHKPEHIWHVVDIGLPLQDLHLPWGMAEITLGAIVKRHFMVLNKMWLRVYRHNVDDTHLYSFEASRLLYLGNNNPVFRIPNSHK